ncbi:hypothetical protein F5148DRAFT_388136 [Russula earlei]|uniref:Uncharacterized protein n=1 Tax=Russula earlei TaxID=71964 RepID=A0ACC0U072_9AGAM|nr:hypothetical protein F5148DRAFT_388136 [Russula earlei]
MVATPAGYRSPILMHSLSSSSQLCRLRNMGKHILPLLSWWAFRLALALFSPIPGCISTHTTGNHSISRSMLIISVPLRTSAHPQPRVRGTPFPLNLKSCLSPPPLTSPLSRISSDPGKTSRFPSFLRLLLLHSPDPCIGALNRFAHLHGCVLHSDDGIPYLYMLTVGRYLISLRILRVRKRKKKSKSCPTAWSISIRSLFLMGIMAT